MKNVVLIMAVLSVFTLNTGCSEEEEETLTGNWVQRSDFDGDTRSNSVVFVIDGYAYTGTGFNSNTDEYYADFWRYDPSLNFWQQVADFPGAGRTSAVAFAIGNKGYVGTGFDGEDELDDFWCYNPSSNEWTQLSDFGGSERRGAIAFALNGKGYVGTGYNGSNLKDFWQYNPSGDTWTQIPSLGGSKRVDGFCFIVDGKAYVGGGTNNGYYMDDFWEFNDEKQANNEFPWTEKLSLTEDDDYTIVRENCAAFNIGNKGYITVGSTGYNTNTTWEYDPAADYWTERTEFEGTSRCDAIAFTINNRGFVALGRNGSTFLDDIWELNPKEEYNEDD